MKYYIGNIPYGNDLTHFGIKGMKWGVRRFQNDDGSLTPAGRERYGSDVRKVGKGAIREQAEKFAKSGGLQRKGTQSQKALSKSHKELENTEEAKRYNNLNRFMTNTAKQISKQTGEHIENIRLNFSDQDTKIINSVFASYQKKSDEIFNKYKDEFASSLLKDLGYNDTREGREYVKNCI